MVVSSQRGHCTDCIELEMRKEVGKIRQQVESYLQAAQACDIRRHWGEFGEPGICLSTQGINYKLPLGFQKIEPAKNALSSIGHPSVGRKCWAMRNLTPWGRGDEHSSERPCPCILRPDPGECLMYLGELCTFRGVHADSAGDAGETFYCQ